MNLNMNPRQVAFLIQAAIAYMVAMLVAASIDMHLDKLNEHLGVNLAILLPIILGGFVIGRLAREKLVRSINLGIKNSGERTGGNLDVSRSRAFPAQAGTQDFALVLDAIVTLAISITWILSVLASVPDDLELPLEFTKLFLCAILLSSFDASCRAIPRGNRAGRPSLKADLLVPACSVLAAVSWQVGIAVDVKEIVSVALAISILALAILLLVFGRGVSSLDAVPIGKGKEPAKIMAMYLGDVAWRAVLMMFLLAVPPVLLIDRLLADLTPYLVAMDAILGFFSWNTLQVTSAFGFIAGTFLAILLDLALSTLRGATSKAVVARTLLSAGILAGHSLLGAYLVVSFGGANLVLPALHFLGQSLGFALAFLSLQTGLRTRGNSINTKDRSTAGTGRDANPPATMEGSAGN